MQKRFRFNFVSADPGAGKTDWAITYTTKWLALGHPVMMVVPTKDLCNEIELRSGNTVKAIHSDNSIDSAKRDVIEVFKDVAKNGPRAIVITDANFLLMDVKIGTENWILIKDEPKEPLNIEQLNVSDSREFLDEFFLELVPDTRELLHQGFLKQFPYRLTSHDDDIFAALYKLQHYVEKEEFEVLFDLIDYETDNVLRYSVYTKPDLYDGWGEVYFMGAYFEDTFIYHQWETEVEWVNKTPKRLQSMPSNKVVIQYWSDSDSWSNRYREQTRGGTTNLQKYIEWLNKNIPDEKFVYVANNKYNRLDLNGERMPAECHGLNRFRDYTKVALIGSYLASSHLEPFYHHYGSSTTDVRGMRNTQYYMQQLTRTAIRKYNNDKLIEIFVPTLSEVRDLLNYLPDATIIHPKKDRWGKLRKDWRKDEINGVEMPINGYNTVSYGAKAMQNIIDKADMTDIDEFKVEVEPKSSAEMQKKYREKQKSVTSPRKNTPFVTHLEFISSLALHITVDAKTKEEIRDIKINQLPWFSVGIFTSNTLKRAECAGSWGIGFDFDGTALTDKQISKIMKQSVYLQYTTVSYNPLDTLRRIRIVVPFSRGVTVEEHDRIKRYYASAFKKACPLELNLDEAKSDPWAKLFAPHAEAEIDTVYRKNNRSLSCVDPETILARIPRQPKISPPTKDDIQWNWLAGIAPVDTGIKTKIHTIDEIIKTMTSGDRSYKAQVIGGKLSKLPQEFHQQIFDRMSAMGVDKTALKQAKKYAAK